MASDDWQGVTGSLAEPEAVAGGALANPGGARLSRLGEALTRSLAFRRQRAWKDMLRRRLLVCGDVLAVILAAVVAGFAGGDEVVLSVLAALPLWIVLAKVNGLYDRDHVRLRHQTVDELSAIFHWVTLAAGASLIAAALLLDQQISAREALLLWGTAFAAAFVLRALARAGWRRLVAPERGIVVGSGELAAALARKLALESGHHLEPRGPPGAVRARPRPSARAARSLDRAGPLRARDAGR